MLLPDLAVTVLSTIPTPSAPIKLAILPSNIVDDMLFTVTVSSPPPPPFVLPLEFEQATAVTKRYTESNSAISFFKFFIFFSFFHIDNLIISQV